MAKEDNLMSPEELNARLTPEERRANAIKANLASQEAKRRNKKFRDELEIALPMIDKDKNGNPAISPITGEPQTIQETITVQLLQKARKGDLKAIKLILETLGERMLKTDNTHHYDEGMKKTIMPD